jgi:acetylornithine deacetylase/succinyl-diaminopimelate desuccinylase-like protein
MKGNFMSSASEYIEQNQDAFLADLFELLRIPSVSTEPDHKNDVRVAAEWVAAHCKTIGMTGVEVIETAGHPVVFGEWLGAGDAPTVLVYGHYDVQPADEDSWEIPSPFEPTIKNGNIVARGSTDDKGQLFIHLKAFEALMKTTGTFPVNIKVLFEGEEEIGSKSLGPFIQNNQERLAADIVVISDGPIVAPDVPAITYGLRGFTLMKLEVSGPKTNLHSGLYGGSVHNTTQALCELIATMHDADGRVTVEGFYDDVRQLDAEERQLLKQIPFGENEWRDETGAPQPWGEADFSLVERIGARPTLEVLSIKGGFIGEGTKAIISEKSVAQVSCRLVPHQDPNAIFELVKRHVEKHTPPTVKTSLTFDTGSPAVLVNRHLEAMKSASQAYEQVYGRSPLFSLGGGSIPVVTMFQEILGISTVLMGFGLPDDGLHGPNEKFSLAQFDKGIKTSIAFYQLLSEQIG